MCNLHSPVVGAFHQQSVNLLRNHHLADYTFEIGEKSCQISPALLIFFDINNQYGGWKKKSPDLRGFHQDFVFPAHSCQRR